MNPPQLQNSNSIANQKKYYTFVAIKPSYRCKQTWNGSEPLKQYTKLGR